MEFFYNFNSNQVVNPLEGITHFFINPYMIGSWKMLELGEKITECDLVIQESTGLPIVILPISLLGLEKVHVKMESNGNMLITNRIDNRSGVKNFFITQKLYAKPTEQKHVIRIDTVLNSDYGRQRLEELIGL